MIEEVTRIGDAPRSPAVYALYGGRRRSGWVAYVGIAGNLRQRLVQHFERRDSSIVTGVSAVGLNVDAVTYVEWWQDRSFEDRTHLLAAEVVAFDILDPALRSRGGVTREAESLAADASFRNGMERLFADEPSGRYLPLTLAELVERISELERRVAELERSD